MGSGPHLAVAPDDVFVAGQLLRADRPARRQASGRDADFRAHAEFAAIGELRRGIGQHDGAVDLRQEFLRCGLFLGDDRVGVVRAVMVDVPYGAVEPVDDAHGQDGVEIFGVPILFGRRRGLLVEGAHVVVAADRAAGLVQLGKDRRQQFLGDLAVDQKRLGRAADSGAPHLRVHHDPARLGRVGRAIEIDVAYALEMRDHRQAAFGLHPLDERAAAARHDDIDQAGQAQHVADREAVGHMLRLTGLIDVIVPRGGRSLIERVQTESRLPVIAHLEGVCHVYLNRAADAAKARRIVMNAKMRRTGICGAAETLLVDRAVAKELLPPILAELHQAGCAIRGDDDVCALDKQATPATEQDWYTEYLDAILAVRVVDGLDGAIRHINHYGSHHTDAIVTEEKAAAEKFLAEIDSAIVLANASTQFADGGEFGMGAEIGISTGRLPPRGPVGAEELTSYKYVVRGDGQVRP